MNKIKHIVLSFIFFSFSFNTSFAIPVISVPQVIEDVFTELRNNYETLVTWKREAEEWKNDYEAITKFKLNGNILKEFSDINDILGKHGLSMGDIDLVSPNSKIGLMAKKMFIDNSFFDNCSYDFMKKNPIKMKICMDSVVREVQEIETIDNFSKEIDKLLVKLNELNTQLSGGSKSSSKTSEAGSDGGFDMETFSQNQQNAKNEAKEQEDSSAGGLFADLAGEESDGSVSFGDFSSGEKGSFDEMMGQFSSAEDEETESDENSMKLSQDVFAGVKSVSLSMKAMRIQYRLMQLKNDAKESHDNRVKHQMYMKKFENIDDFVKNTYGF